MAKKQEKQALDETVKQQNNSNQNYNSLRGENTQVGTNRDDEIYGGYKDLATTGGVDPAAKARLLGLNYSGSSGASSGGSGGGGGGGGSAPSNGPRKDYFSDIEKNPLDTHVYDESEAAFKKMDSSTAQHFADTGGLDNPEQLNRMRGLGVYDEFAKTGGYSEADKGNIRSKALAPISSLSQDMRNDMATRRNVQGGYAPGFDASSRALQRDTSRNIADTSLNAEIGIKDKVNQGKQWGASSAATSEAGIADLKTKNQLEGSRQVASIQQAIASGMMSAAQGRAQIAQVQQQTDLAIASGRTQRDIAEMQVAAANGNAAAARELATIQLKAQNERFVMELEQSGKEAGLGGMSSIYGSNMDRDLSINNSQAGANVNYGGLRSNQADQIGGPMDTIGTGLKLGAGVAGAFFNPSASAGGNKGVTGTGMGTGGVNFGGTKNPFAWE